MAKKGLHRFSGGSQELMPPQERCAQKKPKSGASIRAVCGLRRRLESRNNRGGEGPKTWAFLKKSTLVLVPRWRQVTGPGPNSMAPGREKTAHGTRQDMARKAQENFTRKTGRQNPVVGSRPGYFHSKGTQGGTGSQGGTGKGALARPGVAEWRVG